MTFLRDHRVDVAYDELERDCLGLRKLVPEGATAVVRSTRALAVAASMKALEGWAHRVCLAGNEDVEVPGAITVDETRFDHEPQAAAAPPAASASRSTLWCLYTSGTTGVPKPIDHPLGSLARRVRTRPDVAPLRWGLLYEATRMAGTQVVLQALAERAPLLDATGFARLTERIAWLAALQVEALSATPSMWRQILQVPAAVELPLRQVTLGGEIADQKLLGALAGRFPQARVTHVFASTETGTAFSVSDGREGFPARYLEEPPGGIRLDVRDQILHVFAPQSSAALADGFASTGDVVEVVGDRVLFRGRQSGIVNVAGVKVWPEQVEQTLRAHPEVADALVTPRRNPLSGWILVATVVARADAADAERSSLPRRLRAHCAATLPSAEVPAVVTIVDELSLTTNGKARRR